MRKLTRSALVLATILPALPALFAQGSSPIAPISPVAAKLTIPDTRTLPGVPFDMWIDVDNPADATVGLGMCAEMLVRPEAGDAFTITPDAENLGPYPTLLPAGGNYNSGGVTYLVLRPHEKRTLTLPISPDLRAVSYFNDYRLSPPGRYRIALRLNYCWGRAFPQKALAAPEYMGAVTTNEVSIERVTPTGSDAVVWRRMQELTGNRWRAGQWLGNWTVLNETIGKYPDSAYVPYALLAGSFGNMNDRYVGLIEAALNRFPNSPVTDLMHLAAAGVAYGALQVMTREEDAGQRGHDTAVRQKLWDIATAETAKARQATRPTSRIVIAGREDLPPVQCPPDYDCSEP